MREKGEEAALVAQAHLQQGTVVDLSADIAVGAATLSLEQKLPVANSMILATARAHDATIWTRTRRSDIDLLVVVPTQKRFLDRYGDFTDIPPAFPERDVEILIYTPRELQRNRERPFVRRVLAEGKLVYGS